MTSARRIAQAFIAARREARALDAFPGEVPPNLIDAYAVQTESIALWGEPVVGYKVGGIGSAWQAHYPSDWLAGPVFASHVMTASDANPVAVPVYEGGFAAYEPELVFKLHGLSAPRGPVESRDAAKRFVSRVHIGAEIASSPLASLNALGPGSIISDFGNQSAVVVGPQIDLDWLDRLPEIRVTTCVDGHEVGMSAVRDQGGPLDALAFLLDHLRDHPAPGNPDTLWVSSGAITGVHEAGPGSVCTLDYHGIGTLHLHMVARQGVSA